MKIPSLLSILPCVASVSFTVKERPDGGNNVAIDARGVELSAMCKTPALKPELDEIERTLVPTQDRDLRPLEWSLPKQFLPGDIYFMHLWPENRGHKLAGRRFMHVGMISEAIDSNMSDTLKRMGLNSYVTECCFGTPSGALHRNLWQSARSAYRIRVYRPCCSVQDRCGGTVPRESETGMSESTCAAGLSKMLEFAQKTRGLNVTVKVSMKQMMKGIFRACLPLPVPPKSQHVNYENISSLVVDYCSGYIGRMLNYAGFLQPLAMTYDLGQALPEELEAVLAGYTYPHANRSVNLRDLPPSYQLIYDSDPGTSPTQRRQSVPWSMEGSMVFEVPNDILCMPEDFAWNPSKYAYGGSGCETCGTLRRGRLIKAHMEHAFGIEANIARSYFAQNKSDNATIDNFFHTIYLKVESIRGDAPEAQHCRYVVLFEEGSPAPRLELRADLSV